MTQIDRKREAIHQALRLLGGSTGTEDYPANFERRNNEIHGLMRVATWLGLETRKLEEIWKASLNLCAEEARSKL